MHIAIITAGGAGMFCGSCMHDNSWARGLRDAGLDVTLIPLYTPIRVDEGDETSSPVFFGGINCYLNDRYSWWQRLPRFLTRWLDSPRLIRRATQKAVNNDAKLLGSMTVSMLRGEDGPHHQAGVELAAFLRELRPDVIVFSNALLCGPLAAIRRESSARIFCVLQGDDIFLDGLTEPYRSQSLALLREQARGFDGFLVHSDFYRDHMVGYLDLPPDKFHRLPLAINCAGYDGSVRETAQTPPVVGYFARICPEKGLDRLVEAVLLLKGRLPQVRLKAGGYLGPRDADYFEAVRRQAAPLGDSFEFVGSPGTKEEKTAFFRSVDVLSIPTVYREPKGLSVLEAWANGLPVVLPGHGAYPELVASTGGGLIVEPGNAKSLADALESVLTDNALRRKLASRGSEGVRREHDLSVLARATQTLFGNLIGHGHIPAFDKT